jgi:hypothetical protein
MLEHETTVEFHDTYLPLSDTLRLLADSIKGHMVTVRELLALAGEHGLLLAMILLTIPFLIPISIPGISTVFGLVGIFLSIGIILNRVPWLPEKLLERPVHTEHLVPAIHKGADLVHRIDRYSHLRLERLTTGAAVNRINGLGLLLGNILLLFPLGLVPFSNTLPGWGILLLAAGMVQRDGLLIVLGWFFLAATVIYFTVLAIAALATGQGILGLFR